MTCKKKNLTKSLPFTSTYTEVASWPQIPTFKGTLL